MHDKKLKQSTKGNRKNRRRRRISTARFGQDLPVRIPSLFVIRY